MSETLSKQKMKDVINADWTRTTTQSPYYEGVRRTYNELLNDIDDGRFNTVIDYKAVTDRLQKESDYWNNEHSKETERADKLQKEIESLKAITELAVKEKSELFDESVRQKKRAILAEKQLKLATIGLNYILSFPYLDSTEDIRIIKRNSSDVLEANVRLQNVQT